MAGAKKEMKTMLATENKQEATEVIEFLGELTTEEKRDFMVFMQTFRLAKSVIQKAAQQTT